MWGYEGHGAMTLLFQNFDYDAIERFEFCVTPIPPKWQAANLLLSKPTNYILYCIK